MPIPDWTAQGLLPPGQHLATLPEIKSRLCWNPHRDQLWQNGLRWLVELTHRDLRYPLWIGGSFTTDKEVPMDVDIVLDLTWAEAYHQFLGAQLFHRERAAIKERFCVDFCPNLPNNSDFCSFFQYVGEKTALQKGLSAKSPRGVLRVQSWADGLKT